MVSLLSEKYYLVTSRDVQLVTANWQRRYSLNNVHATPYSISNGVGDIKIFYEAYNPEFIDYYEMVWEKVANPEKIASFINALASRRINGS